MAYFRRSLALVVRYGNVRAISTRFYIASWYRTGTRHFGIYFSNAAVTRYELGNFTSYSVRYALFMRIVRILIAWYAFTIAQR